MSWLRAARRASQVVDFHQLPVFHYSDRVFLGYEGDSISVCMLQGHNTLPKSSSESVIIVEKLAHKLGESHSYVIG